MNFLKVTRHAEWWEYKLVPLLSIGYATVLCVDVPIDIKIAKLLFLLAAIIVGAIYVSVINDLTDIDEDALAGKKNRMADASLSVKIILVAACIGAGFFFGCVIYPDRISLFLYVMAWVVFSLYSIRPFRLKKRGFLGVLCDAAGAHFFPTLLITTNIIYADQRVLPIIWYFAVGTWSLFYGLRGILWHQFFDRDNDIKSCTTTFASRINPSNFRLQEVFIFSIEMASLSIILYFVLNIWITIGLVSYIFLVLIRKLALGYDISLIITPPLRPHQLLMNDFYLVFFPLSLLVSLALSSNFGWLILICHFLLFPKKSLLVLKDCLLFLRRK